MIGHPNPRTDGRARILIVDDEPSNARALERIMEREGYQEVRSVTVATEAVEAFREFGPDLVLLDLHMPGRSGFDVLADLEEIIGDEEYLPILVLTGDVDPDTRERALAAGAKDFLTKPFDVTEAVQRVRNLLETRLLHLELRHQNQILETRVAERTRELREAQIEILYRLALAAEYRDDVTGQHAERVGVLSGLIAEEMGVAEVKVDLIRRAAPLHDIGKIGIPDAILLKPDSLTAAEFEVMKSHTVIGGRILSGSSFPLLQMARLIALYHHERWDGRGYHPGIAGEAIPLPGRIVCVADTWDCLVHERPYKSPIPAEAALDEIRRGRGVHFDPAVVDAFISLYDSGGIESIEVRSSVAAF